MALDRRYSHYLGRHIGRFQVHPSPIITLPSHRVYSNLQPPMHMRHVGPRSGPHSRPRPHQPRRRRPCQCRGGGQGAGPGAPRRRFISLPRGGSTGGRQCGQLLHRPARPAGVPCPWSLPYPLSPLPSASPVPPGRTLLSGRSLPQCVIDCHLSTLMHQCTPQSPTAAGTHKITTKPSPDLIFFLAPPLQSAIRLIFGRSQLFPPL